jgi:hypothetical protein
VTLRQSYLGRASLPETELTAPHRAVATERGR